MDVILCNLIRPRCLTTITPCYWRRLEQVIVNYYTSSKFVKCCILPLQNNGRRNASMPGGRVGLLAGDVQRQRGQKSRRLRRSAVVRRLPRRGARVLQSRARALEADHGRLPAADRAPPRRRLKGDVQC